VNTFPAAVLTPALGRHKAVIDIAITRVLHRDYETRSRVDLRKVGAAKYAADKTTEVLCAGYAVDDGPVLLWRPGDPVPMDSPKRRPIRLGS
jgi:hypothetical protein